MSVAPPAIVAGALVALAVLAVPASWERSRRRLDRLRALSASRRSAAAAAPAAAAGRISSTGPAGPAADRTLDVADLAEHLAAAFRAGLPPSRTWALLAARPGPFAPLAAAVAQRLQLGVPGGRALWQSAARGRAAAVPLAAALDLCERSGAPTAEVLDGLAAGLRAEEAAAAETRIALAAPKATAAVMSVLPVAGLGLGALLGVDTLHVLLVTGPGHLCLLSGAVAWAAGRWWVRRLVRTAEAAGDAPDRRAATGDARDGPEGARDPRDGQGAAG